jgi:hypothetical protein
MLNVRSGQDPEEFLFVSLKFVKLKAWHLKENDFE